MWLTKWKTKTITQCWNNWKHNAGTIQKSNRKIVERGKIDTPKNTKWNQEINNFNIYTNLCSICCFAAKSYIIIFCWYKIGIYQDDKQHTVVSTALY